MSGIITILVIVWVISAIKKGNKAAQKRPRPGNFPATPGNVPTPAPQAQEKLTDIEKECGEIHQGEASCRSDEGFAAAAKAEHGHKLEKKRHEFNRKVESARAANATEMAAPLAAQPRLSAADMRRAFVMSEVLSKPVSLREERE